MVSTVVVVLSDPEGGEDSLGRVFNALALAHELDRRGDPVEVLFQGAGTRWPARLARAEHPVHGLFVALSERIGGASRGCAAVFGATEACVAAGVRLVDGNPIPGTAGLPSLAARLAEGARLVSF